MLTSLLALCVASPTVLGQEPARSPLVAAPEAPVELPMLLRGPSPAVHVRVNGEGPFLFLIDTGAQGAARVDSALVEKLGLEVEGTQLGGDPTGRAAVEMPIVAFASLELGGVRFEGVRALSRDYNAGAPGMTPIDGVLGYHLFAELGLTLDFAARRVGILPLPVAFPAGARLSELRGEPGELPTLSATVGGVELADATLDTGKMGGFGVPPALLERLELRSAPVVVARGRTISGEFEVLRAPLAGDAVVGDLRIEGAFVDSAAVMPRAVIGAGFLAGARVTLVPSARVAWLRSPDVERRLRLAERGPAETVPDAPTEGGRVRVSGAG